MIEPYYSDDYVTIYHGDCLDLLDSLTFDVIVTDPPYGLEHAGVESRRTHYGAKRSRLALAQDYQQIHGDQRPFDPAPFLVLELPTVLFGANHYAHRLPPSPTWLVWDKLDGLTSKRSVGFNDSADVELAWSNLGGPARLYSQRWIGMIRNGRNASHKRVHPTEKPVELMAWVLAQCPPGLILDPFMGSGPTLRAAKDLGRKAIGIEIEERYCEIAVRRCAQEVLPLYD